MLTENERNKEELMGKINQTEAGIVSVYPKRQWHKKNKQKRSELEKLREYTEVLR